MTRRSARATLVALLAAALLPFGSGVGDAGAVASPLVEHGPEAGGPGGGDPYYPADGNGGYDVLHYDVRDRYHFGSRLLTGTTRITARATAPLTRFHLDLLLGVEAVSVNGRAARFAKPTGHELKVIPAEPIAAGATFGVTVRYRGVPTRHSYLGESNFRANDHEVVAVNEPHMAPWWFPANDHPRDKARFDISVIVARGKEVVSNGRLMSRRNTATTTTFHWRPRDPMATYQAYFVAGALDVESGYDAGTGFHWKNAVSRHLTLDQRRKARLALRRTPNILAWLQKQLGAYPFEVTGGVRPSLRLGFSLENQTRPVYGFTPDAQLLVHELSHQWLGNSVGLERWRDIWLNEGLASWMQWRYDEARHGIDPQQRLISMWEAAPMPDDFWMVPIGNPGPHNQFDWSVYQRGAMAVQALRHRLGDTLFWRVLRGWVALNRNSTATTEDFIALSESIGKTDLSSFWEAWLVDLDRPARTADNGLA